MRHSAMACTAALTRLVLDEVTTGASSGNHGGFALTARYLNHSHGHKFGHGGALESIMSALEVTQ